MSVRSRSALLVLLAFAGIAAPAEAARPALPTLAQQLYLYGTGSGYVRVRLTAPIPLGSGLRFTVMRNVNAAGFVGALLVREHVDATGIGVLQAWQPGGVARQVPLTFGPVAEPLASVGTTALPAGTYRLYLLTRGTEPVHAVVYLAGAPGGVAGRRHLTVPANAPAAERFAPAPGVAQAGRVAPIAAAAGTHALNRRGLLVRAGWWSADVGEGAPFALHHCAYADLPPVTPVPACAGDVSTRDATELRSTRSASVARVADAGTWTQQVALTVAGAPQDAGVALVWADLGAGFPTR